MKVDSVTRPVIDAQLTDAFADGPYISKVAQREAADTDLNASPGLIVAEFTQPVCEEVGLADLDRVLTIVHISQESNSRQIRIALTGFRCKAKP